MRTEHNQMSMNINANIMNLSSRDLGNLSIKLNDVDTAADFAKFAEFLAISDFCYTKEESLKIIDDEIQRLEYSLK